MVADERARAFHDPALMWWDETAQFLRRTQSLRRTNPEARQFRAMQQALRLRIVSLPRYLEADTTFELEERHIWCEAMNAIDEICRDSLNGLWRTPTNLPWTRWGARQMSECVDHCKFHSWEPCTSGPLETIMLRVCQNRLWIPRAGVCLHPRKCSSTGKPSGNNAGNNTEGTLRNSSRPSADCVVKSWLAWQTRDFQEAFTRKRCAL